MLRKWEYHFSKEVKTSDSTESQSSFCTEKKTSESVGSQITNSNMSEIKQSQSRTSTAKMFSLVFKAKTKIFSPAEPWNKASLDIILNELFDMYFKAFKIGALASLEPIDKVIARIAESSIVDPMIQENSMLSEARDHSWEKSYSVVATASENEQLYCSESSNHSESSNRIIRA